MKRFSGIIGGILASLVGIARGVGGLTLVFNPENMSSLLVGIGLLIVAVLLIVSGVLYAIKRSDIQRKAITIATIFFWIDGIINGFILFGAPLLSGQIINLILVFIILGCIWYSKLLSKH